MAGISGYKEKKRAAASQSPAQTPAQDSLPLISPKPDTVTPPSIVFTMLRLFKYELASAFFTKSASDLLQFASPLLLRELIAFVSDSEAPLWHGLIYAGALYAVSQMRSLIFNTFFYTVFRLEIRVQTALMSAIYEKSLRLNNAARRERTMGEIVNLMAIDVDRFQKVCVGLTGCEEGNNETDYRLPPYSTSTSPQPSKSAWRSSSSSTRWALRRWLASQLCWCSCPSPCSGRFSPRTSRYCTVAAP